MTLFDDIRKRVKDRREATRLTKVTGMVPNIAGIAQAEPMRIADIGKTRFVWGRIYTEHAGWYQVYFLKRVDNPALTLLAKVRTGDIIKRGIDKIGVPSFPDVPRIDRGDFEDKLQKAYHDEFIEQVGDWDAFNWIRDKIADGLGYVGRATGKYFEWLWDVLIQPQIDKVQDTIMEAMKRIWNQVLSQIDKVKNRANQIIEDFYEMTRLTKGYLITPVHYTDLTAHGFKFESYGQMTLCFIIIGEFIAPERPGFIKRPGMVIPLASETEEPFREEEEEQHGY